MIESSFLSSSAWDSDLFQDFTPENETSIFDAVELEYLGSSDILEDKFSAGPLTPDDLSSASSSDCEWFKFDLNNILPVSDTFVSHILDDESNAIGFGEPSLSSISGCPNKHTASSDNNLNHVTNKSTAKWKTKLTEYLFSSKSWSKMTPDEQLQTLHTLSEIVTCHMGIREQMEVIKIIDPSAIISPDDKEFALDSSFLNNSKLRRIKDIVKKNVLFVSNSSKPINRSPSIGPSRKATNSTNSRFHPAKRRQRKQKIPHLNEHERKVQKQGKKEVQSGLFVYEKIIVGKRGSEETEDVNILE